MISFDKTVRVGLVVAKQFLVVVKQFFIAKLAQGILKCNDANADANTTSKRVYQGNKCS